MKGRFLDKYGIYGLREWLFWVLVINLIVFGSIGFIMVWNISWAIGVETEVTGTIQLHILRYDKFWNMKFTDCELRTYSGDTHHVRLLGHWELEFEHTYRIRTVTVNYWGYLNLVQEVVNIEEI